MHVLLGDLALSCILVVIFTFYCITSPRRTACGLLTWFTRILPLMHTNCCTYTLILLLHVSGVIMWLTMSSLSPDPTLTVGNVTRAMEKVTVDKRRQVWESVLGEGAVEEIYSCHSSEEEKLHSCADIYVTCKPDSSWEELVMRLYYGYGEMAAAKEAKTFLQQRGGWLIV